MMAADVGSTMTTINDLNIECLSEILLYIDVGDRLKLRGESKKFRDAVDSCWQDVRAVRISYPMNFNELGGSSDDESSESGDESSESDNESSESDDESSKSESNVQVTQNIHELKGTHRVVTIRTSGQQLLEGVLKRCGDFITTLSEDRHMQQKVSVLPFAIDYCSKIDTLITAVIIEQDDEHMSQLLDKIKKLRFLDLRINYENAKLCFSRIPTDHLEVLFFATWECRKPSNDILNGQKEVLKRCSSSLLTHFSADCFDNELLKICGKKINLVAIQMRFVRTRGVTESGLNHILSLKNLRTLVFTAIPKRYRRGDRRFLPPVTDDFLMNINKNLPLLEYIDIEAPQDVSDEGFKSLANLKRLQKLRITECSRITARYLSLFSELRELDLMCCEIYNKGVIELLKKTERMQVLNLDYTKITNKALKAAVNAVKKRTNGIGLTLSIVGTDTSPEDLNEIPSLLKIIDNDDPSDDDDDDNVGNIERAMPSEIDDNRQQCLVKIFSYIDVEARIELRSVCKEWRDAVDACWKQVREVKIIELLSEDFEFENGGLYEYDSDDYEEKVSGTHQTVEIRTDGKNKLIKEVLKRCGKHITTLAEYRLERNPHEGNNPVLPLAIKYCEKLEKLDTTLMTNQDDRNMRQLLSKIDKLKSLTLRIYFQNAKLCFHKFPTDNLEEFTCIVKDGIKPLDGILIGQKKVIGDCSLLRVLSINYFDDELLKLIGEKVNLETLDLSFMNVGGVSQRGLDHILNLRNLRTLMLTSVPKDKGIILKGAINIGPKSKRGQRKGVKRFSPPVTDDFLKAMVENLVFLEVLEIEGVKEMTDEGFTSLGSLTKLKKLRISECGDTYGFIGEEDLVLFSGLEELDLTKCDIDEEGVIKLLEKADKMRVLNLDYCYITNQTIVAAVKATEKRTNGIRLTLHIAGTDTSPACIRRTSALLRVVNTDDDDYDVLGFLSNKGEFEQHCAGLMERLGLFTPGLE